MIITGAGADRKRMKDEIIERSTNPIVRNIYKKTNSKIIIQVNKSLLRNPQTARISQSLTLNALIDHCIKEKNDKGIKAITALKATASKDEKAKTKR